MNTRQLFITVASWEPRFLEGTKRLIVDTAITDVICFWFSEFGHRTADARKEFQEAFKGTPLLFVELPMYATNTTTSGHIVPAYVSVWRKVWKVIQEKRGSFDSFILDITTMPREALWIVLDCLTEQGVNGQILYHRAKEHGDWCGSEPERPHIVPKMGGIQSSELPTHLLIVSGYDADRSEQFIAAYEPTNTLILFQEFPKGACPENELKSETRHRSKFANRSNSLKLQGVNCYSSDWGFDVIFKAAQEFAPQSNLIMTSLGPKTSAVSIYRVHRKLPSSGLLYAPCKNYSESYSNGLGETLAIEWDSSETINQHDSQITRIQTQ